MDGDDVINVCFKVCAPSYTSFTAALKCVQNLGGYVHLYEDTELQHLIEADF